MRWSEKNAQDKENRGIGGGGGGGRKRQRGLERG